MREGCKGCERPVSVCVCDALPHRPFHTRTRILLLQHPHEARHKLSTLPLLLRCLSNSHSLLGRRFQPGSFPLLDSLALQPPPSSPPALLLFPSPSAQPLSHWFAQHQSLASQLPGHTPPLIAPDVPPDTHLILLVVDGTWQHAREMVKASAPFLDKFAVPVCLPFDAKAEGSGMGNSDLILRKEPFAGCVSTLEAVASCLKVLEPRGLEIEQKLLSVLRSMVQFQASHISIHKTRIRQRKKVSAETSHSLVSAIPSQVSSTRINCVNLNKEVCSQWGKQNTSNRVTPSELLETEQCAPY